MVQRNQSKRGTKEFKDFEGIEEKETLTRNIMKEERFSVEAFKKNAMRHLNQQERKERIQALTLKLDLMRTKTTNTKSHGRK